MTSNLPTFIYYIVFATELTCYDITVKKKLSKGNIPKTNIKTSSKD